MLLVLLLCSSLSSHGSGYSLSPTWLKHVCVEQRGML